MRATTTTRIPPLALAAAAGLHALVGIALLDLWQRSVSFDDEQPLKIEIAMPAASPEQEPTAEPMAAGADPGPRPPATFTIASQPAPAASGKLPSARILTGNTQESLDQAALGMVQRARLPRLPPGLGVESAAFTNPIYFAMR